MVGPSRYPTEFREQAVDLVKASGRKGTEPRERSAAGRRGRGRRSGALLRGTQQVGSPFGPPRRRTAHIEWAQATEGPRSCWQWSSTCLAQCSSGQGPRLGTQPLLRERTACSYARMAARKGPLSALRVAMPQRQARGGQVRGQQFREGQSA